MDSSVCIQHYRFSLKREEGCASSVDFHSFASSYQRWLPLNSHNQISILFRIASLKEEQQQRGSYYIIGGAVPLFFETLLSPQYSETLSPNTVPMSQRSNFLPQGMRRQLCKRWHFQTKKWTLGSTDETCRTTLQVFANLLALRSFTSPQKAYFNEKCPHPTPQLLLAPSKVFLASIDLYWVRKKNPRGAG